MIRHALIAGCLFGSAQVSEAAILSVSDGVFGANSVTRDSATGLEWLDLSRTAGLSFNAVNAGLGSTYASWRFATLSEVDLFFVDAGITPNGPATTANYGAVE